MTDPDPTALDTADPRIRDECVAAVRDGAHDVVLVGVVHDHPASVYRVRRVVEAESPDVLALELPPLAVPLFEQHAADTRTPPASGGEMSAAVQAAETDSVVGIDGPTPSFLGVLATVLYRNGSTVDTVRHTARSFLSISRETVEYWFDALVGAVTSHRIGVHDPTTHESSWNDPPARQAADERAQIKKSNAMLAAFDSSPTAAVCTEARERYMATRLSSLRESGDVVAVVGMGHLDALRTSLDADD